jgi:L-amino acid N-acyltransferase YncA
VDGRRSNCQRILDTTDRRSFDDTLFDDTGGGARPEDRTAPGTITLMTGGSGRVRDAGERDAEACAAIYAPYVTDTAITFETEPPSCAVMAARIAEARRTHAWVVLEERGRVVGSASSGPFKSRAAYRWSCEVSVYLEVGRRRGGGGRLLYEALFARLVERGFRTAVAGMTLPNEASVGLHRALGFEPVGTYRRIGWKHGAWHDVAWAQRTLGTGPEPPPEPE